MHLPLQLTIIINNLPKFHTSLHFLLLIRLLRHFGSQLNLSSLLTLSLLQSLQRLHFLLASLLEQLAVVDLVIDLVLETVTLCLPLNLLEVIDVAIHVCGFQLLFQLLLSQDLL